MRKCKVELTSLELKRIINCLNNELDSQKQQLEKYNNNAFVAGLLSNYIESIENLQGKLQSKRNKLED